MLVNECGIDCEGENGILKKQICGKALDEKYGAFEHVQNTAYWRGCN